MYRLQYNGSCNICNRKVLLIDLIVAKKAICRFKLNIYMFFYQISRIFFRFLIISWYNFIVFYCIFYFGLKRFLVSALNTMGGIHKKYEDLPQFNADWLTSLRTWYCFKLCFSFSCSGFDLTVIKKSHIINYYMFLCLMKTQTYKFIVVGNCGSSLYY